MRPITDYDDDIARLNNMMAECRNIEVSVQAAKDEAQRETLYTPPSYGTRRVLRPFQALVGAQTEKNRRDRSYRDRLAKERKLEQQKHDRREQDLDRAMNPIKPAIGGKHQRSKRSMSSMSLFFRAVRPLSTAWGSERTPTRHRTASELDFPISGKPSLVLSLNDAQATVIESDERPCLFQLFTEDGGRWLIQATTLPELELWIQAISVASRKRSTYIPHAIKPAHPDPVSLPTFSSGAGAKLSASIQWNIY